MAVFSKTSCKEVLHPWCDSCMVAAVNGAMYMAQSTFMLYMTFYLLRLLLRKKRPTLTTVKQTAIGIMLSTAFLTSHSPSFSLFHCYTRKIFGSLNIWTVAFFPGFLSGLAAILIERPSRRPLIALYTVNIATEILFRMAVNRGWFRPIKHGEVYIFMPSMAALMYFYKTEARVKTSQDATHTLIRFVVGPYEDKGCAESSAPELQRDTKTSPSHRSVSRITAIIHQLKEKLPSLGKHHLCLHPNSCAEYTVQGATKMFSVGYILQVCLHLLPRLRMIVRDPKNLHSVFINKTALRFGAFLGGFSATFRMVSCLLRRTTNVDSTLSAIPAGLLAGLAFFMFPDNTIALYVMLKTLQIAYMRGVEAHLIPPVPCSTILVYSLVMGIIMHSAVVEPSTLRTSYWKFLFKYTGGRIAAIDRGPLDVFGLESSRQLAEVLVKAKTPLVPWTQF